MFKKSRLSKKFFYASYFALFDALTLLVSLVLIIWLLYTKNFTQLIHPRYLPFFYVTIPLLFLLFVYQITLFGQKSRQKLRFRQLIYILPLLIYVVLNPWFFQTSSIYSVYEEPKSQSISDMSAEDSILIDGQIAGGNRIADSVESLPKISGAIDIPHEDYAAFLFHVFRFNENFLQKRFTFLARIEKSPFAPEGMVLLGRPVMLCCAADSQSLGIFAKVDQEKWKIGSWVYVTGDLAVYTAEKSPEKKLPYLTNIELRKAGRPASIYAFFYGEKELGLLPNP